MHIRPVTPADTQAWLQLRLGLWPETSEAEHREEIRKFLDGTAEEPQAALLAFEADDDGPGTAVGLVELSLRAYAEECQSSPVAYLEGWYVIPRLQGQGIGRQLVEAAEAWGRAQGCSEFASDTEADNELSRLAHLALGFEDVGLVRCFRKGL